MPAAAPAWLRLCQPCCADLTMKRVISGILAMLIVLPSLEITSGINGSSTSLALGGLKMLHSQAITAGMSSTAFNSSIAVSCPLSVIHGPDWTSLLSAGHNSDMHFLAKPDLLAPLSDLAAGF